MAAKFRQDASLGTTEIKMALPKDFLNTVSSMFTSSLDKGGLLRPTEKWLNDVKMMDQLFNEHHPEGSVRKGTGVTTDFAQVLEQNIIGREPNLLSHFSRLKTGVRVREMNARHLAPKKGTLRGMRKQAETIY